MMRTKLILSLLAAALLTSGAAWGSLFTGLYEAEVAVADQTSAGRGAALADALRLVAVKVSGDSGAADSAALKEALRNPARYVQQYSYRANDGTAPAELPLLLGASFDSRGVDQLLQGAGLPVWGSTRPLTIAWLAVEQDKQKMLVGANDRGLVRELLEKAAQRRGLPLRLPLLDATDRARVQATDAWGDFHATFQQASQRYEAQAVLVGRLGQVAGGRWQVRWTLYQGGAAQSWSQQGDKVEPLVAYGIDAAADTLAVAYARAAPVVASGTEFHWVVKEVRDLRGYRRLMDYLASLPGVSSVQPEQLSGDGVRLRIAAGGGEGALQQQVSLGGPLAPLAEEPAMANPSSLSQPGDRHYRLVP